jgi:predicted TIM-barrel fold metal-dependent hydrolase
MIDLPVIVSSDSHIGPRLKEDLRGYCPKKYLGAFDDFSSKDEAYRAALAASAPEMFLEVSPGVKVRGGRNRLTEGHFDMHARLRDMNFDGVAGEVIFHGSQNDEPIPFSNPGDPNNTAFLKNDPPNDFKLAALGRHIYNAWLADACSIEPERHVGLAQIPIWDVRASVKELEWARAAGLRGVNFPTSQSWHPAQYNKPLWEPLWAAAEALAMPLVVHTGAGGAADYSGPDGRAVALLDIAEVRRAVPWMIFSGVFERHPNLKVVLTEMPGQWWSSMVTELDSAYRSQLRPPTAVTVGKIHELCPKLPSEYCRANVFVGASFMNHLEAEAAAREGYYPNYLWGSDYPHMEGTYQYPANSDETPVTHLALRFAFEGIEPSKALMMLGANAIRVFGLDASKLQTIADRINTLSLAQLNEPIDSRPDGIQCLAFRRHGSYD